MPKELCPHCKINESTGLWAIVDKNQGMYKTEPEPLCDTCASDMLSSCNSYEEVKKVSK